jgi:hypothetical protein
MAAAKLPTPVAAPALAVAAAPGPPRQRSSPAFNAQATTRAGSRDDSPDAGPEVEAEVREIVAKRPKMIALTLLDGTTIQLPAPPKKRASAPDGALRSPGGGEAMSDQLTARDLVSALRAVAHGADASEILGSEPRWETLFSALLSLMLKKGLIADWEFVEEFRNV